MAVIDKADVRDFLGLDPLDTFDDRWIEAACKAAVDYVTELRPDRDWVNPSQSERLGLIMLAARLFERRGADGNDQNAGYEFSGPIPLIGREIQELLRLGRYYRPVVA